MIILKMIATIAILLIGPNLFQAIGKTKNPGDKFVGYLVEILLAVLYVLLIFGT